MHQDILINITNSVLRCLNLTHSYSGMYCQDLAVYIRKHDFSMIYQSQTSHAASCKCISCTGTSSPKAEYCDLRPADFFTPASPTSNSIREKASCISVLLCRSMYLHCENISDGYSQSAFGQITMFPHFSSFVCHLPGKWQLYYTICN